VAFSLARFRLSRDEERVLFLTVAGLTRAEICSATGFGGPRLDQCWVQILSKTQTKSIEDAICAIVGSEAGTVSDEKIQQRRALERQVDAMREVELTQKVGSVLIDRDHVLDISIGAKAILGITETRQNLHDSLDEYVHADDQARLRRAVSKMFSADESFDIRLRFVLRTGLKLLRVKGKPLGESTDRFLLQIHELEQETPVGGLVSAGFGLEAIATSLPDLIYVFDLVEGKNVYASPSVDEVLGYSAEDLLMMGPRLLETIVHPEDFPAVKARGKDRLTMRDGEVQELDYRIRHGAGHWIYVSTRTVIFARDESGSPSQILGILQDVTKRRESEERLRRSEETIRRTLEDAPQGVAVLRLDGGFLQVNPAFCQIFGFGPDELVGGSWAKVANEQTIDQFVDWLAEEQESKTGKTFRYESTAKTKTAAEVLVNVVASVVRDSSGNPLHIIAQVRDVTEARLAAERIKEGRNRFEATLESLQDGVVFVNEDCEFVIVNRKAGELVGTTAEELLGKNIQQGRWPLFDAEGNELPLEQRPLSRALRGETVSGEEYLIQQSGGDRRWLRFNCAPLYREGEETPYAAVSSFLDISVEREQRESLRENLLRIQELHAELEKHAKNLEAKQAELEEKNQVLSELASTDALTGLRNRRRGFDYLATRVTEFQRYGRPLTVAMIDIDQFKSLNDSFGHLEGDRVLTTVAEVMSASVRSCDFVARYGGEEFLVIMPETRLADGLIVAERIRESVEAGVGAARPVTVSIGVVAMALGVDKPEDLISQADQALYQSKSSGRNIVSFYDHGAGEAFNLAPAA